MILFWMPNNMLEKMARMMYKVYCSIETLFVPVRLSEQEGAQQPNNSGRLMNGH